jgi:prevent-host-death family protein
VRRVALSEIRDDLSRFLREAEGEEILITRNGNPAGLLIGFVSENDWLDYRLENYTRFLHRWSVCATACGGARPSGLRTSSEDPGTAEAVSRHRNTAHLSYRSWMSSGRREYAFRIR